jgi:uncharacterized protein YkwD
VASMRQAAGSRRARLFVELLEPRNVPSGYQPTAQEQLFLEELNAARANPSAYGASIGVDLSGIAPSQPLAFNTQLIQAARDHSQDMNDHAYFNHDTPQGVNPGQRITNAGFTWTAWGESIAAGYATPAQALQGLITDSGVSDLGHRRHLLAVDAEFVTQNQVGIGIVQGGSGPYSDYYTIDTAAGTNTQPFITGVVFNDGNGNQQYDAGEGLGGVTVTVSGVGSTTTFGSGGYGIQVAPGTYTINVSGPGLNSPISKVVTVGASNVEVDFTPQPGATTSAGSGPTAPALDFTYVGDFNGDGKQDLMAFDQGSGSWYVKLSTGSGFSAPQLWNRWSPSVPWVNIITGDFTGNGKTDIGAQDAQTGAWFVGVSTGSAFVTQMWDAWSPSFTWVNVNVGDFNGDGKADLVGQIQQTGDWYVAQSTGTGFVTRWWDRWAPGIAWSHVMVGDLTGNGRDDIIAMYPQSGAWYAGLATGSSFNTRLWDVWSPAVTWVDVNLADLTGNGREDLIGRIASTGQWYAGLSTPNGSATQLWDQWSPAVAWVDVHVVDLMGNGREDLIGRIAGTGVWYAALSTPNGSFTQFWGSSSDGNWANVNFADFTGSGKADVQGQMADSGSLTVGISGPSGMTFSAW